MSKNKKSIGARALGNRTIIGIICVVAALAICSGGQQIGRWKG